MLLYIIYVSYYDVLVLVAALCWHGGCWRVRRKQLANTVFWQWVNQSYNAGFNYSNRNANSSLTTERLGGIYLTATTISCGIALGLGKAVKRAPVGAGTAALLAKVEENSLRGT